MKNCQLVTLETAYVYLGKQVALSSGVFPLQLNVAKSGYTLAIAGWNLGDRYIGRDIHITSITFTTDNNTVEFYGSCDTGSTIPAGANVRILLAQ